METRQERALLSCCYKDNDLIDKAIQYGITPAHFTEIANCEQWKAMLELHTQSVPVDLETMLTATQKAGTLGACGGLPGMMATDGEVPTSLGFMSMVEAVCLAYSRRELVRRVDSLSSMLKSGLPVAEMTSTIEQMGECLTSGKKPHRSTKDIGDAVLEQARARLAGEKSTQTEVYTGLPTFDKWATPIMPHEYVVVGGRTSHGKAQPVTEPILLESGHWKAMGEIEIGDRLCSVDGDESVVTRIFPQGVLKTYRVTVSDGLSTLCCADHLWEITSPHWNKGQEKRVVTTIELMRLSNTVRYKDRLSITRIKGRFGRDEGIDLHPYLLGVLIGDGCITSSSPLITSADSFIVEKIRVIAESYGCDMVASGKFGYRLSGKNRCNWAGGKHQQNPITKIIRSLGLYGTNSNTKFIPQTYLTASYQTRLELLQGLLDTDGGSDKRGNIIYSTVCEQLANDVVYLARSLGCRAGISIHRNRYFTYLGERRKGQDCFEVSIMHEDREALFSLPRKRRGASVRHKTTIRSVVEEGEATCQCIMVSHARQLYVTRDFIVTHNSSIMSQVAAHNIFRGLRVAYYTIETSAESVMSQMAAQRSNANAKFLHQETKDRADEYLKTITAMRDSNRLMIFDNVLTLDALLSHGRMLANSFKPDVVFLDYLNIIGVTDSTGQYETMTKISKAMIPFRKALKCALIAGAQFNRGPEKDDRKPQRTDFRDSGSIEEDAHRLIAVWRKPNQPLDNNFFDCEVLQLKLRDGPLAGINAKFNARTTKFFEESSST